MKVAPGRFRSPGRSKRHADRRSAGRCNESNELQSERQAPLPVRLVAGPHSGRNADWIATMALPGRGRWLWLVGALQRPLATAALDQAPMAQRERLLIEGLPGGCPCCAAGTQLAAGLARVLRRQRRDGQIIEGLILQVEPEGDPARLADNLLGAGVEDWLQIEAISAVVRAEDLAGSGSPGRSSRTMRCLGAAGQVHLREAVTGPVATRLGPDWAGLLVPVADPVADPAGERTGEPTGEPAGEPAAGIATGPRIAAGWTRLDHDPFGGQEAGEAWQELARWPPSVRFDRRAVPGWLDDMRRRIAVARGRVAGPAGPTIELALIARTERDWLGWRPDALEVPLAWRSDSRLAWRRVRREVTDAAAAVDGEAAAAVDGEAVTAVTVFALDDLPADIADGLAVAPLLATRC